MNNNRYNEDGFLVYVQDLVDSNCLNDIENGISKRMIDKGYDFLTKNQKLVFDRMIKENSVEKCKFCGCEIPWCEMQFAVDNGGYCSGCYHNLGEER